MGEGGHSEKVACSKRKAKLRTLKSVKIDTLFMTKIAAKWLKSIPNL